LGLQRSPSFWRVSYSKWCTRCIDATFPAIYFRLTLSLQSLDLYIFFMLLYLLENLVLHLGSHYLTATPTMSPLNLLISSSEPILRTIFKLLAFSKFTHESTSYSTTTLAGYPYKTRVRLLNKSTSRAEANDLIAAYSGIIFLCGAHEGSLTGGLSLR
jgi:hypothetical protein